MRKTNGMINTYDRCSRIAKLLLIENEVLKLERESDCIKLTESANLEAYEEYSGLKLTPIEILMGAILKRVVDAFDYCYNYELAMAVLPQQKIGDYIVDFLVVSDFSDDKVVIECDGHDYHEKTKLQAKHDKERDRYLTSKGYKVLRYTGSEIYNDFERVERELKVLLDAPSDTSLFSEKKK